MIYLVVFLQFNHIIIPSFSIYYIIMIIIILYMYLFSFSICFLIFLAHSSLLHLGSFTSLLSASFRASFSENLSTGINPCFHLSESLHFALILLLNLYFYCKIYRVKENKHQLYPQPPVRERMLPVSLKSRDTSCCYRSQPILNFVSYTLAFL